MKKKKDKKTGVDFTPKNLTSLMRLMTNPSIISSVFANPNEKPSDPNIRNLKNGFTLVTIEIKDYDNRNKYAYLHKDGVKVSDVIFRQGGISSGFKEDGFCALIRYDDDVFEADGCGGYHCIINDAGEICLTSTEKWGNSYPSHVGGIVGRMKDEYYNLVTGEKLKISESKYYSGSEIKSPNYVFVGSSFGSDKVYKINLQTAEVEIFE